MARCGRCGFFKSYEGVSKQAGVCLMFRGLEVPEDALWEHRSCFEYTQRLPDWTPEQHFDFEMKRYNVESNSIASKRAFVFSSAALVISIITMLSRWF
jgi:hypothetical protein